METDESQQVAAAAAEETVDVDVAPAAVDEAPAASAEDVEMTSQPPLEDEQSPSQPPPQPQPPQEPEPPAAQEEQQTSEEPAEPPRSQSQQGQEIEQEDIKVKLKEIISEIEKEVVMAEMIADQLRGKTPTQMEESQEGAADSLPPAAEVSEPAARPAPEPAAEPPTTEPVNTEPDVMNDPFYVPKLDPADFDSKRATFPPDSGAFPHGGGVPFPHDSDLSSMSMMNGHSYESSMRMEYEEQQQQSKKITLEKLFTPADDSGELTPSRRKMYASSAFYTSIHPTVQEQVELARKISSSLCDSSNKTSKGQNMYVKRMKRSEKWVHEGTGQADETIDGRFEADENRPLLSYKIPGMGQQDMMRYGNVDGSGKQLKLVMNPCGKVIDLKTLKTTGLYNEHGSLSPDICFDLVRDLNAQTGKGAQLFAKRRKKSEKWVVDETTVKQHPGGDLSTPSITPMTPSLYGPPLPQLPPPSFIDRSRVEHVQKMNEIQERFSQPRLRMVKSPWEAALQTGNVDTAFENLRPSDFIGGDYASRVADSVITAAEIKSLSPLPPPQLPPLPSTYSPAHQSKPAVHFRQSPLPFKSNIQPRAWDPKAAQRPLQAPAAGQRVAPPPPPPPQPQLPPQPQYIPPDIPAMYNQAPQPQYPPAPAARTASNYPSKTFYNKSNYANYNTAARGWSSQLDYYRPITFS